MFLVYVVLCLIVFGCQYRWNWLPGKTRLRYDLLCVEWDVKPYTLTRSRHVRCGCTDPNCTLKTMPVWATCSVNDRSMWLAHVCGTTCPKISAIPDFQSALLADISKRNCFLPHLWRFDIYAPCISVLTYLLTLRVEIARCGKVGVNRHFKPAEPHNPWDAC